MDQAEFFMKNTPFPYFVLDKTMKMKSFSNSVLKIFPECEFLDLIETPYREKTKQFLSDSSSGEFIEILMMENNQRKRFYQVYKSINDGMDIHVFCLPIKTELEDIQGMMLNVERKIIQFNGNLSDKKAFLKEAISGIKSAALTLDHHQNIETLAAGIAHEIRNPLTTVKGFIQLLRPHLEQIGKQDYADIALEELNRANNIIYEFLNAAKPQTAALQVTSINKLVKDLAMLYESEAILRNIQVITSFSSQDVSLCKNTNQLKQVVTNIIKNAMEAIDEQPVNERNIFLSTTVSEDSFKVIIQDSGCGMNEDMVKHLFIPFYSTKEKGTGIGLSVSKDIIDEIGGTIQVESLLGNGTTFTISFPHTAFASNLK